MKITLFSNYLNHHQLPFCNAMLSIPGIDFTFVACTPFNSERLALGYEDMNYLPFVVRAYDEGEGLKKAWRLCVESDVVIHGAAYEGFTQKRIKRGLPVFRCSERLFKNGLIHSFSPRAIKNVYDMHTKHKNAPVYMLCASAFTAKDFARMGAYKNKAYRWGYFPELKKQDDVSKLIESKKKNSILWVGRFLPLKHPEYVVEVAKRLKKENYDFTFDVIGNGEMEYTLRQKIAENGLEDRVRLLGSMHPEKVREHMEKSEIFLFTSDRNEGWGAVLNESMNSGCAVIASHIIGSTPFLIKDGENGLVFKSSDVDHLYRQVKWLLDHPQKRKSIGAEAYNTLVSEWNAEVAAQRFVKLSTAVLNGDTNPDIFESGPCSCAELIGDGYKTNKKY